MIKSVLNNVVAASVLAAALAAAAPAAARDATYTVTLNQDNFFGFNPSFNGLVPVDDKVDFSLLRHILDPPGIWHHRHR